MKLPFQIHAELMGQAQSLLGGAPGTSAAKLTIYGVAINCTHSEILDGFELAQAGKSNLLMIEQCEFLASLVPAGKVPRQGQFCTLVLGPWLTTGPGSAANPYKLQLWTGGLQPGGLTYRFMLVSQNYQAG